MTTAGGAPRHPHPPSVDRVLGWPPVRALAEAHGRRLTLEAVRDTLAACRRREIPCTDEAISRAAADWLEAALQPSLRPVFNLTGTVIHTNLGRAPLPQEAIDAMVAAARGSSNLEYDLDAGGRGDRDAHVEPWLCRLTGAEAATVVNNNAAAVLLTLNTLAADREVLVSRGELIEIGGSFRLPDIMRRAGCRLHEVGTTNRTHLRDYAGAMAGNTAMVLKAHTSNYRVEGFTAAPAETDLAGLCREHDLPFAVDLGSGTLVDLARFGLPAEPTPAQTLGRGVDLVTFSGDKLLGGPQAGIIAGRRDLVRLIAGNPMKRALRCDKLTLAALEAVLRLYADPDTLTERVPVLRLLSRRADAVAVQAHRLAPLLRGWLPEAAQVDVVPAESQIGSGSLPLNLIPSHALRIRPAPGGESLEALAGRLRRLPVPVIGRIADAALHLDLRCLDDEDGFSRQFMDRPAP